MERNSSRIVRDKIVFLILFVLMVLTFFLPFKIIETIGGTQRNIFGFSNYVNPSTKNLNGFEFPVSYFVFIFVPLAASLILFSTKKAAKIIGLIAAILHMIFMALLFFAINFHLHLFGPKSIVKVGIGYYFLLGFSLLFIIQVIITFRTGILANEKSLPKEDLLDDF